ncbi:uncharacterized protein LOC144422796 [Styela clava]
MLDISAEMKENLLIFVGIIAWIVAVVSADRGEWNALGSYQYYVSGKDDIKSYVDGEKFCKNNDGEMAMIKTSEIQTFIQNQVSATSGQPYGFYIGLKEVGTSNTFKWKDNSELTYDNWYLGEPHVDKPEPCVAMGWFHTYYANLPWYDVKCAANAPTGFVCQRLMERYWETWSSWSTCNCSSMMKERYRTCIDSGRLGPNICIGSNFETTNCSRDTACNTTSTAAPAEMTTTNIYHKFTTLNDMTHTSTLSANANNTKSTEMNIFFPTGAINTTTMTSCGHDNLLVAIVSSIATLILAIILFGIGSLICRCKIMRRNSQKIATQPQSLSEMNRVVNDVPSYHENFDEIQTSQLNSGNYELREEKEENYEIPHNYEKIKDGDHQYEEMNNSTTKEHPYIN